MLRDADSYRDLLDRTAATLDKMEEQLKSNGKEHRISQSDVTSFGKSCDQLALNCCQLCDPTKPSSFKEATAGSWGRPSPPSTSSLESYSTDWLC